MIAYLKGKLADKREGFCVVDVGGIGYELMISNSTLFALGAIGEDVVLHSYMHVKEDGISLLGFSNKDEKDMFLQLICVGGVGPKLALTILSSMSAGDLRAAIARGDDKMISKIKGVGKKTSERIVLELKDKVEPIDGFVCCDSCESGKDEIEFACEALVGLGISKSEAAGMIRRCYELGDDAQTLVEKALRGM